MTKKELIKLANDKAVIIVRILNHIEQQEYERLAKLPESQAINELTVRFLIRATSYASDNPC